MNGNRFTQIYTFSSQASPFLNSAQPLQEGQWIHGLDYDGRRRACENGSDFFELIPHSAANLTLCMGVVPAHGSDSHVTLFYASIDPLRRKLRYLNAGHEPALLHRARQNRAVRLENTGSEVQREIPLAPGDLLVVFSQGVAETYDMDGQPFGSAGVLSILRRSARAPAADLVEEILEAAERHAGRSAQSSDRTVAVVRFTGSMAQAISEEAETELSFAAA